MSRRCASAWRRASHGARFGSACFARGGRSFSPSRSSRRRKPRRAAPPCSAATTALAGAVVGNLSPALADELGLGLLDTGVVVIEVREGSPAARVGLKPGDIILRVAGREVRDVASLSAALQNRPAGPMRVAIRRDGRVMEATLAG
ncbi:MAG: PDZ domain-containing protein [Acetobacteraceae bacterium]|nr:PDZ domain-containing protein [Acetobacteraceae bacterium]